MITGYNWELYNVAKDFTQSKDLASAEPAKLKEMQDLFYAEAAKYNVLPIDNDRVMRLNPALRPSLTKGRKSFTYYPGAVRIPEGVAPDMKNRSWSITAKVNVGDGDEGMIATLGGLFDGWALYLDKGKPVFHYNLANAARGACSTCKGRTHGRSRVCLRRWWHGERRRRQADR